MDGHIAELKVEIDQGDLALLYSGECHGQMCSYHCAPNSSLWAKDGDYFACAALGDLCFGLGLDPLQARQLSLEYLVNCVYQLFLRDRLMYQPTRPLA